MARIGWIMTGLLALFLLAASAAPKFLGAAAAVDSLTALGWPTEYLDMLGTIELICVVLFVIPRTSLLGVFLWLALYLRDAGLRRYIANR